MAKLSKQKVAGLIIIVAVLTIFGVKTFLQFSRPKTAVNEIPARAKGDPQAKFKIVEYIDFQCPACAQGVLILSEYFAKYPGQMYVEVKYFPLPGHQFSMPSARYAECAARQKKFWPFVEKLMAQQRFWAALHDPDPAFRQIAQQVDLNSFQLDNCLNDKYVNETIATEKTIGASLGIQSTPTYFINDKMVVGTKSLKDELATFFKESPAEMQTGIQIQTQAPLQSLIPKPQ